MAPIEMRCGRDIETGGNNAQAPSLYIVAERYIWGFSVRWDGDGDGGRVRKVVAGVKACRAWIGKVGGRAGFCYSEPPR